MDVPRKLLMVRREPPHDGFNIMIEHRNRTMTWQLDGLMGEALMAGIQDHILKFAVARGFATVTVVPPKSPRKRRS